MENKSAVCNDDSTDQNNVKNPKYESIQLNDSRKNDDLDTTAKSSENSSTNDEEKCESKTNEAQNSMDGQLKESDTCSSEKLSSEKSIGNKNASTGATADLQNMPKGNDTESDLRNKLNNFLEWSKKHLINLSPKVSVTLNGTAHRYGMVSVAEIKKGEVLFTVPRKILLNADSGSLCEKILEFEDWCEITDRDICDGSGWVPLLLTLMYEYRNEDSKWKPYLDLLPSVEEFGHPLFWTVEELEDEMKGNSLLEDIKKDISNIEEEYNEYVVPFLHRNKDICTSVELYSLEFYKRMVAFVMSYSFTEFADTSPEMIPMADMLNHHTNNNACLIYERNSLKMISTRKIEEEEEIFNTFGKLGNMTLLQMYGYVETPANLYDSVAISVKLFIDYLTNGNIVSPSLVQAMKALLNKTNKQLQHHAVFKGIPATRMEFYPLRVQQDRVHMLDKHIFGVYSFDIAPYHEHFIFDKNGLRTGPDLITMLKILHMSEAQFQEMLQTRSGNRPNSFYKKLLRKLKLAKKTDVSSGIAVIDITEEDDDENERQSKMNPHNEKRKHIECQEIEDNGDDDVSSPKRRFVCEPSELNGVELGCGHYLPLYSLPLGKPRENELKFGSRGESCSVPILIDDESDEDEDLDMADDSSGNIKESNSDEKPTNVETVASADIIKQNDPSKDIHVMDNSNIQPSTNTGESNKLSHNSNFETDAIKLENPIEKKSQRDEALVNKTENVNTDDDYQSDDDEDLEMADDSSSNIKETNSGEKPIINEIITTTDIAKQNNPSKDIQVIDNSRIQPSTNTGESNKLSHNSNLEIDATKLENPIEKKSPCGEALANKAESANADDDECDVDEDLEMADDSSSNIKETNSGEKPTNKESITSTDIVNQNNLSKDIQVIDNSKIQSSTNTGESNKLSHNSNLEIETTKLDYATEKKSPRHETLVNKAENVNTDDDEYGDDEDLEMSDDLNSNIKETNSGEKPTNKQTVTSTDIVKQSNPSKDIQVIDHLNIQPSTNTGDSNELLHHSNLETAATTLENPIEKKFRHDDDVVVNKAENVVTDESHSEMNNCDTTGAKRDNDCLPDLNTLKENDKSKLPVKNNKKENKEGEIQATRNDFTHSFESKEECTDKNAFLNNIGKNNEICKYEASCIMEQEDSVAVENEDVGSVTNDIEDVNDDADEDDQNEDCKDEELEDECDDEIEFLSEGIRCMMTYEKLNSVLQPEWRDTMKGILEMLLRTMKQDDHIKNLEQAEATLTRNQLNAYHIRQGQRKIIKIFQNWLT